MGYSYFPHGSGDRAASKHEALIWNNIYSKSTAKSYKQNKADMQNYKLGSLTAGFLQQYSFYYPPLLMFGHISSANDKGKSAHTTFVMTFILTFHIFVK